LLSMWLEPTAKGLSGRAIAIPEDGLWQIGSPDLP